MPSFPLWSRTYIQVSRTYIQASLRGIWSWLFVEEGVVCSMDPSWVGNWKLWVPPRIWCFGPLGLEQGSSSSQWVTLGSCLVPVQADSDFLPPNLASRLLTYPANSRLFQRMLFLYIWLCLSFPDNHNSNSQIYLKTWSLHLVISTNPLPFTECPLCARKMVGIHGACFGHFQSSREVYFISCFTSHTNKLTYSCMVVRKSPRVTQELILYISQVEAVHITHDMIGVMESEDYEAQHPIFLEYRNVNCIFLYMCIYSFFKSMFLFYVIERKSKFSCSSMKRDTFS